MTPPTNMVEWLLQLPIPWLVGGANGQANATALGTVIDAQISLIREAVKARMPQHAPDDALPFIGNDRGLILGLTEAEGDFAIRLYNAWNTWSLAGTAAVLLNNLYPISNEIGFALIQQNGLVYTLTGPPTPDDLLANVEVNELAPLASELLPDPPATKTIPAGTPWWTFDNNTDLCSRFAIVVADPAGIGWDDIQDPPTDSSNPSINEVNQMRQVIAQWKPAKATCMGIYVLTSGLMWGYPPDQVWGAGSGDWGGDVVIFST